MSKPSRSEILAVAVDLRRTVTLDLRGLPHHKRAEVMDRIGEMNLITKRAADLLDRMLED